MPKKAKMEWPLGKGSGICIHDNVLPQKLCKSIIKFFEDRPHFNHPGKTFGGVLPQTKHSMDAHITGANEYIQNQEEYEFLNQADGAIYQLYRVALAEYISQYAPLTNEWHIREDTGYQYQRYTQNEGFYKSHIDGAPFTGPGGVERVLASVMYLNTVEEGGGTYFDYFDFTCEAKVGRIVTFPATFVHLHGGLVPRSSDKCIISTFVTSPPPTVDTTYTDEAPTSEIVDTGAVLPDVDIPDVPKAIDTEP
jgi:hypothetical protein